MSGVANENDTTAGQLSRRIFSDRRRENHVRCNAVLDRCGEWRRP